MHFVCQVYTWGHRLVTPRRVVVARNLKKVGSAPLKFHRMERLHVVSIAAGMVHSMALTKDGALFYWVSSDPDLRCQQVQFDYFSFENVVYCSEIKHHLFFMLACSICSYIRSVEKMWWEYLQASTGLLQLLLQGMSTCGMERKAKISHQLLLGYTV